MINPPIDWLCKMPFEPTRACWVLPTGAVIDVEEEGATTDGGAISHGIYVKKWISFRLDRFHPDAEEKRLAEVMRSRAQKLLSDHPSLRGDGSPKDNPYYGDTAYKQAAIEQGWIRVRPPWHPGDTTVRAQALSTEKSGALLQMIREAAASKGFDLQVIEGGPLSEVTGIDVATQQQEPKSA